ncbi:hypothetical protein C447_09707 [Halococcus hamelinensis 100A6]|uniref:Uncharacterized protein n=1 Tax=Halococcus hamelinensis 100A6 TaxID=1132509 RepID=M0M1Z4_9EURY|nr:hypothetical protein C447_09707 [Halococcus hamelinensis 100A6]
MEGSRSWSDGAEFARRSLKSVGREILCMDEDDDRLQTEFKCDDCGETVTTEDDTPPFSCPHCGGEQGFTAVE